MFVSHFNPFVLDLKFLQEKFPCFIEEFEYTVRSSLRSIGSSLEVLCQIVCTQVADSTLFTLHKESIQGDNMTYLSSSL